MPIVKLRPIGSRIMTGVNPTARRLVRSNTAGVMAPATGLPQIQSRARPLENAAPAQTYVSFTNTPAQRPSESPYFRGPSHTLGGDMPPNPATFYLEVMLICNCSVKIHNCVKKIKILMIHGRRSDCILLD